VSQIGRELVDQVLSQIDIVELIGGYVDLKPSGSGRAVGRCPFHQEKTPSFSVNRERQIFYCFGCGKGGDAIAFLREYEGLSFMEALRQLAERVGVSLPETSFHVGGGAQKDRKELLLGICAAAQDFFTSCLADPQRGDAARAYLEKRGMDAAAASRFGLGFAPDSWSALHEALRRKGFHDADLVEAGMIRARSTGDGHYAFFRNRIMAPIRDAAGRIVGFGGRDLSGDPQTPKYINTQENAIYRKSELLYGLHDARDALRKRRQAVLVEGYFDVMRCMLHGIDNVVAPCGTALTSEQAGLLRRYANEVVVLFDGDAAGVRAALRGVSVIVAAGLHVRALLLPDGQDPDDFVGAHGGAALRERIDLADELVSFYVAMNADRVRSIEGRTDVARELLAVFLNMDDLLRREEYIKEVGRLLRVDEWTVRREFDRLARGESSRTVRRVASREEEEPRTPPPGQDDQDVVAALLQHASLRALLDDAVIAAADASTPLGEILTALNASGEAALPEALEQASARALYYAAAAGGEMSISRAEALVKKRISGILRAALQREAADLIEQVRAAEARDQDTTPLLVRQIEIRRRLERLGAC